MIQINIISIKGLFVCLFLSLAVQCCVATTVSITGATADPGDTVTVPLMINNMDNYGTGTINIEYNPAVTHITDVTSSSDSSVTAKNINNTIGLAKISAWNIDGVSGDIIFADVKINVVGNGGDSTPLTITVVTLQDASYTEISPTVSDGSFTITGQASTNPTLTSTPPVPSTHDGGISPEPQDEGTDVIPTPAQSDGAGKAEEPPTTHDPETSTSPSSSDANPTAQSTPEPPSSKMPGFEAILLVAGLLMTYLIIRLNRK
jgi:hypothetical protein